MKTVVLTAAQWEALHYWAYEGLDHHCSEFDRKDDPKQPSAKGWDALVGLTEQLDRIYIPAEH